MGLSCKKHFCGNPARLPAKVISIGNLTLGGTGKTPAVIAVAQEAKKRGYSPCILTRGYKGKAKDISFVSRGEGPLLSPIEAGDEAFLMAQILEGTPVVKGTDRYKSGLFALDNLYSKPHKGVLPAVPISKGVLPYAPTNSSPLFILDDGFQHWKLHRDVDVLLIDATNPFGNERLFPEGIMREPFSAMKRAHVIVITKADMAIEGAVTAMTRKIKQHNQEAPIFTASHKPAGLIYASGETRGLDTLRDKKIYAFSGIANPAYFKTTLTSAGGRIAGFMNFRDHHNYSRKDLDKIKAEAAGLDIVTTEKDLVKLRELKAPDNLSALKIGFSTDNDFYDYLFGRLT
jgi:tetraacyldisaccharide 4'-kinase